MRKEVMNRSKKTREKEVTREENFVDRTCTEHKYPTLIDTKRWPATDTALIFSVREQRLSSSLRVCLPKCEHVRTF